MPADCYYINEDFSPHQGLELISQEMHHLVHVMRKTTGDVVEVMNGRGQLAKAQIEKVDKKRVFLKLLEVASQPASDFEVILAHALPRPNRLDFIVEKGTELGMTQIWLFPGDLSDKHELSANQLSRVHSIMVAAMKQSGQLFLPELSIRPALERWTKPPFTSFYGDLSGDAPWLGKLWMQSPPKEGVILFIGPEGGFSQDEKGLMHDLGCQPVRLHENILRTDTAALAGLSLIAHLHSITD